MLKEILKVIKSSDRPVSLDFISEELKLDKNALDGMLQYLRTKGKITETPGNYGSQLDQKKGIFTCPGCPDNSRCNSSIPLGRRFVLSDDEQ